MSSEELALIRARLARAANYSAGFSVSEARRSWYAYTDDYRFPANLRARTHSVAGLSMEWVQRDNVQPTAAVLYLHGGGYVCGSIASHRPIACELAQSLEGAVVSLDYRLAPEHPFPAALEDVLVAYQSLISHGLSPSRVALAGESAGAGLAVAALLCMRERGLPRPAAALCISPWADLTNSGASVASKAASDPIVFKDSIDVTASLYLNGHTPEDPLASPAYGNLLGLPPLLIQVGSSEILVDDAVRLARAAAMADVNVTLEVWPRMLHAWHIFSRELSEGREASARAAAWLNQMLKSAGVPQAAESGSGGWKNA